MSLCVLIDSKILNERIGIVFDEKALAAARRHGIKEVIYTAEEVRALKGVSSERLRAIHAAKKQLVMPVFGDCCLEQVLPEKDE